MTANAAEQGDSQWPGQRPRVSVIVAFLNAERFIAEAIESVLAQDYRDFELILVDDGSAAACCSNCACEGVSSSYEAIRPVTAPTAGSRANARCITPAQPTSTTTSSSTNATTSPRASRMPRFRAQSDRKSVV